MTDIVERLKRVRYTRERGDGPNGTYFEEPCDADDTDAVASLINPDGPDAAVEIERLRGENEVTAADLHAWMKLKAAAEACLAEAVEVLRTIVGTLDDPTGGQHVADMRSASATARAFIAKLEAKP